MKKSIEENNYTIMESMEENKDNKKITEVAGRIVKTEKETPRLVEESITKEQWISLKSTLKP